MVRALIGERIGERKDVLDANLWAPIWYYIGIYVANLWMNNRAARIDATHLVKLSSFAAMYWGFEHLICEVLSRLCRALFIRSQASLGSFQLFEGFCPSIGYRFTHILWWTNRFIATNWCSVRIMRRWSSAQFSGPFWCGIYLSKAILFHIHHSCGMGYL